MLIQDVINQYIDLILPRKPKSILKQTNQLKRWSINLPRVNIDKIAVSDIIQCRNKLLKTINNRRTFNSYSTCNRYIAVLAHLFTIAVTEWMLLSTSPFAVIKKLKEPPGRTRYLTDAERDRLLLECRNYKLQPYLYTIVMLLLTTGARRSEILKLTWAAIDLNRRIIVLTETKNGSCRTLYLNETTVELLSNLYNKAKVRDSRYGNSSLVFPSNGNKLLPCSIRRPWASVLKRAEIYNFRLHDLRHSAASYLAMSGASLLDIATILGHKSINMTMRYSHLNTNHLSGVMNKMTNELNIR